MSITPAGARLPSAVSAKSSSAKLSCSTAIPTRSPAYTRAWTSRKTTDVRDALRQILTAKWAKPMVFLACGSPLALLGARIYNGQLGANPVEFLQHFTGDWTLRVLLITL